MELGCKPRCSVVARECWFMGRMESVVLDIPAELRPPAPAPRAQALGPIALLRVLARNPLEAWTEAHFEQPVVASGLSIGRVVVVNDPAAIRRVLLENCDNYEKDWLQRRVLSAGLTGGLLTVEDHNWRMQRRALAPLFARKTVLGFSSAMIEAMRALHRPFGKCNRTRESNRLFQPITAISRAARILCAGDQAGIRSRGP